MKVIILSGGEQVRVDDEDYAMLVAMGSWHLVRGYASRYSPGGSKNRKRLFMHRVVLGVESNPGINTKVIVDHINQNKLDNRKSNLRPADRANNYENGIIQDRGSRGITIWRHGKYVYWRYVYKNKVIGYFKTRGEAEKAKHKHICQLSK